MKKFYISDLDGTLLNPYGEVTSRSFDILNTLLSEGMDLTFATARTASTALISNLLTHQKPSVSRTLAED